MCVVNTLVTNSGLSGIAGIECGTDHEISELDEGFDTTDHLEASALREDSDFYDTAPDDKIKRTAIQMNARYHAGLREFKRRCSDNKVIRAFIDNLFTRDRYGISTYLRSIPTPHFCDVGCGDGVVTAHLLSVLQSIASCGGFYNVIEPVDTYIEKTRARVQPESNHSTGICISFDQSTAETHFTADNDRNYHVVFSSHSMHLIELTVLKHIASSLAVGGFLLVIIGNKGSVMSELKDLFVDKTAITGEDITSAIQQLPTDRFKVAVEEWPSVLDLSGIELPESIDDLTEAARNLLSLMVQTNLDDLNQQDYSVIRQIIQRRKVGNELKLDNDCIVMQRRS